MGKREAVRTVRNWSPPYIAVGMGSRQVGSSSKIKCSRCRVPVIPLRYVPKRTKINVNTRAHT